VTARRVSDHAAGDTATDDPAPVHREAALTVVPLRHWGRWVTAVLLLLAVAAIASSLAQNDKIKWSAVPQYLFSKPIIEGLWHTILLTVLAQGIGILLGVILATCRIAQNPVLRSVSWLYIWAFRGTPLLVQLIFWFNLGLVFERIDVTIPGLGWTLVDTSTNSLITPFAAALLGLALNEGAYMAEIVRSGFLGVDPGQAEAAAAIGMTPGARMRRIILPQAIRTIIPPTGNETINMLKTTSLASVIAYSDLLSGAKSIYNKNLLTLELLMVASIWYIVLTSILSVGQFYLEAHYAKGSNQQADSLLSVWKRAFSPRREVAL
jgi:polar amino acid transport system permease protein